MTIIPNCTTGVKAHLDSKTQGNSVVLDWPPQRIHLNIIQALWVFLKEKQKTVDIQRRALKVIQEAWRIILEGYLKKLQENLAERVEAALKTKDDRLSSASENCTFAVFVLSTVSTFMFAITHCTNFPFL